MILINVEISLILMLSCLAYDLCLTYYIDVMDKRYVGQPLPQICCVVMNACWRILFVNVKEVSLR